MPVATRCFLDLTQPLATAPPALPAQPAAGPSGSGAPRKRATQPSGAGRLAGFGRFPAQLALCVCCPYGSGRFLARLCVSLGRPHWFWAVLQLLGLDFDMVPGVLGGFVGVILIACCKSPDRKLAKPHASLQNRPELALASFGSGKPPPRILPISICGYGGASLADSQASLRPPRACCYCARLLTKENVVEAVQMCGCRPAVAGDSPVFACGPACCAASALLGCMVCGFAGHERARRLVRKLASRAVGASSANARKGANHAETAYPAR